TIVNATFGSSGGSVLVMALQPIKGSIEPSLIDGRLPAGPDEVALGTETMHDAGTHVGATVLVKGRGGLFHMRVVGQVAVPNLFFSFTRPGQGAAVTI